MPAPAAIAELEAIVTEYPNSPAAHEAHLSLARHLASTGDPHAYDHYKAALALDAPPLLKLEWARYLESVGRSAEAYSTYREIFRRYPNQARPALKRIAPDPLTLASDLLDFRFPEDALAVLPAPTASGRPPLLALRARAFLALGRVDEALAAYDAWLFIAPDSQDARLGRAGALARLGRLEEALAIYASIPTIGAQLARGEILDGLGRKEEALDIYRGLSDSIAWWRAAGLLEQMDLAGETLPFYEQAARSGSSLADDAAYRLLVLAGRLGDSGRSVAAAQILENMWPNYFTLLARDTGFSVDLAPSLPTPAQAAPVLDKARALDQIGHPEWAISELAYAARATEDPKLDLALGQALYQRGACREAFRIGASLIRHPDPAVRTLTAWRLAYPKAYPEEVAAAAAEFGVDPLFIWSVMRQESSYNPEVVSFAYAQGLMQVIPSTRDDIARALKISVGPESMFDPPTSIRFGAYFLGAMWRRFGGDPEYTAVAYNGGAGTVDRTLSNSLVGERDDFYRWITKVESREFVNRVMLNYAVYRWLEQVEGGS